MAKGRMINRTITRSRKFQKCGGDFTRLLYCMILPFLDRDGKMEADPLLLKADLFPLRSDVTDNTIQMHLELLSEAGLLELYTVGEEQYLRLEGFRENQEGMRWDKEKESSIPDPESEDGTSTEKVRTNDGASPEQVRSEDGTSTEKVRLNKNRNKNRNKKENRNKNSPLPPSGGTERSPLDCIIDYWNERENLPRSPMACNLPNPGKLADIIIDYGPDYVKEAISTLSANIEDIERQYRPGSIKTFLENSVSRWHDFQGQRSTLTEEDEAFIAEVKF